MWFVYISSYFEHIHIMLEFLQLFHPLLNDVLNFRLGDHQNFLIEEQNDEKQQLALKGQKWLTTHLFLDAFFFCGCDVVTAMLSNCTQHADTHLIRATEQLQSLLMLRANLPVKMACLVHQLVSLERRRLVMRLDMRFTVVGQAHEAWLHSLVATANAEITEGFTVHMRKWRELWELAPWLVVDVEQITSQHRPWSEGCMALWTAVHTHMFKLVPVDRDAFQAVSITAGNGDRVSYCVRTQSTVNLFW